MPKLMSISQLTSTPSRDAATTVTNSVHKTARPVEQTGREWNKFEKIAFRFFFIYFLLLALPLDWKYFIDLLGRDSSSGFDTLFYAFKYAPRILSDVPTFGDWGILAVFAVINTVSWSLIDGQDKNYDKLYYWLRVILRYRLALALIGFALIKFFPMQMPEPSLSNLNTNYGDISDWKIFSMSTGIVPGYERFLGLVELSAALLLLNRKTASIGAFIILPFTGNVVMSNIAYEGGEYVYSLMLVSFALFIIAYDVPRLLSLTSAERYTLPASFRPSFVTKSLRNVRLMGRILFFGILVIYAFLAYNNFNKGGYQFPNDRGLSDAAGIYNVSDFKINGDQIPYSPNDPIRWKDVVFEKWSTLSIRNNQKIVPLTASTEEVFADFSQRDYESSGITGRHYYNYALDTLHHQLQLSNKNANDIYDKLSLTYARPAPGTIVLKGIDPRGDSIHVVLNKIDKKYLMKEAAKAGRKKGLKL